MRFNYAVAVVLLASAAALPAPATDGFLAHPECLYVCFFTEM